MGSTLRLLHHPASQPCRSARQFLIENDIPFEDDIVDITLRVAMGVLLSAGDAPSGSLPYTDGAFLDDSGFPAAFPYLVEPVPGSPN